MKLKASVVLMALAILAFLPVPVSAGAVRLTMDLSADVLTAPSSPPGVSTFTVGNQPVLWGFGWEVIPDKVGFGGDYLVSFSQDLATGWWLDWYAPALSVGWHPIGPHRFVDPYGQIGIGSAGRVHLSGVHRAMVDPMLSLCVFPFASAGVNLNLDGLIIGAKAVYTPYTMAIPATTIRAYDLGALQVMITAGFSLGW